MNRSVSPQSFLPPSSVVLSVRWSGCLNFWLETRWSEGARGFAYENAAALLRQAAAESGAPLALTGHPRISRRHTALAKQDVKKCGPVPEIGQYCSRYLPRARPFAAASNASCSENLAYRLGKAALVASTHLHESDPELLSMIGAYGNAAILLGCQCIDSTNRALT